jgi:hypothetical protein
MAKNEIFAGRKEELKEFLATDFTDYTDISENRRQKTADRGLKTAKCPISQRRISE